ncbi:MAG: LacI family DNA-binding transcriptional regulator [Chloroflexi bacterium]|nr:LacI family DNA-binding transcriptional regulator [Chloroflexota bacterium]
MATLKDVARLAEVDPSTVSRVLRGDPSQAVRGETRDRIIAAAGSLRYRPNALARSLRTRRTDTIGLIIPSLENVGFSEVTHGIQAVAAAAGKLVVVIEAEALVLTDAASVEELYSRLITDGRVDGLIVAFATVDDQLVAQLAERGTPLVLVNRRTAGIHGSVVVDDERGSDLAVKHLAGLGHRRLGYIGIAADTDTARRRERGFREAMARAGLDVREMWLSAGLPTIAGGRQATGDLLARAGADRPTGLFVASLQGAIGVLAQLRGQGVRIPADMSIIAFNDHELAEHLDPPLTTVRMPNFRMGEQAVHLLLEAIDGEAGRDEMIDDAPEVVVRGSTASV